MVRSSCTLLFVVALLLCACERDSGNQERVVFWTPTAPPTQTERIVIQTTTPLPTHTPVVQVVTSTPEPEGYLCVTASEAVYLRPSASMDNYPIVDLPFGAKLTDFGGREEGWAFVQFGVKRGWVSLDYVQICE